MKKYLKKPSRELISYVFWGVMSFLVNMGLFRLLLYVGVEYWITNIITIIFLKFFVFTTNKLFVFKTKTNSFGALLKEFLKFLGSRIFTNLLDYFGLILMVEVFGWDAFYCKLAIQVVITVVNYIFSKYFIFKKKPDAQPPQPEPDGPAAVEAADPPTTPVS